MATGNRDLRILVKDEASGPLARAESALARLEESIAVPKVNIASRGPRPTPLPVSHAKKARRRAVASLRKNRSQKSSRRKRGRR